MSGQRKRTPAELWHALERMTEEVELERIDALTDEELDREVRAAGLDPQALERALGAIVIFPSDETSTRAPRGAIRRYPRAPSGGLAPARSRPLRWLRWFGAGVALLTLAAVIVIATKTLGRRRDTSLAPASAAAVTVRPAVPFTN